MAIRDQWQGWKLKEQNIANAAVIISYYILTLKVPVSYIAICCIVQMFQKKVDALMEKKAKMKL